MSHLPFPEIGRLYKFSPFLSSDYYTFNVNEVGAFDGFYPSSILSDIYLKPGNIILLVSVIPDFQEDYRFYKERLIENFIYKNRFLSNSFNNSDVNSVNSFLTLFKEIKNEKEK